MTLSNLDDNGIGRYAETTSITTTISALLNLALASVSAAITKIKGLALRSAELTITGANTWNDVTTLAVNTLGRPALVEWTAIHRNANSGAARVVDYRIVQGVSQTQAGDIHSYDAPLTAGLTGYGAAGAASATPAAGSTTWRLQARCSVSAAVIISRASLKVTVM